MAKIIESTKTANGGAYVPPSYEPSPGKVFSTIRLTSTTVADVVVEHDESWAAEDIIAAAKGSVASLNDRADWWCPEEEKTLVTKIFLGDADPDEEGEPVTREPLELTDPNEQPDPEVVE